MDKYEFNIKVEQIKKLVNKQDFATAMKIADTIDWRRVRNANLLSMISQVYEKNREYQEAKEVLLLAFERAPIGKRLLYKLTELALREGSVGEAEDYYREFCDMAPDDTRQYLLRYMLLKEKKAPVDQLIHALERYTATELDEKWMYELAELYTRAGRTTDCIQLCDKMILMFAVGNYVERAMELKQRYAPLTHYQQDLMQNRERYEEKLRAVEEGYENGMAGMQTYEGQEGYGPGFGGGAAYGNGAAPDTYAAPAPGGMSAEFQQGYMYGAGVSMAAGGGYGQVGNGYGQAEGGYVQAANGYGQAEGGYVQATNGYVQAANGYSQAESGYAQSGNGYAQTEGGYMAGTGSYVQPGGGYAAGTESYGGPESGYAAGAGNYNQSGSGYTAGDGSYVQPGTGYAPTGGNYGQAEGGYAAGTDGYGQAGAGYGSGRGGYGQSGAGYAPGNGGYGQPEGGYASGAGSYGQSGAGYVSGSGGYGQAEGGYVSGGGNYSQPEEGYGSGAGNYVYQGGGNYSQPEGGYMPGNGNYGQSEGGYVSGGGSYGQAEGGYATGNGGYSQPEESYVSGGGKYGQSGNGYVTRGYGQSEGGYVSGSGDYGQPEDGYVSGNGDYGQPESGYGFGNGGYGQPDNSYGPEGEGYGYQGEDYGTGNYSQPQDNYMADNGGYDRQINVRGGGRGDRSRGYGSADGRYMEENGSYGSGADGSYLEEEAYYQNSNPIYQGETLIDEELVASLHQAAAEKELAAEMSKISTEDYVEQEPQSSRTKVFRQRANSKIAEAAARRAAEKEKESQFHDRVYTPHHLMIEAKSPETGFETAVEVLKKIHQKTGVNNQVIKISGSKLSNRGVFNVSDKLAGKDLIIEEAGDLRQEDIEELQMLLERDETGMIVVLIDNPYQMEELHHQNPGFINLFKCINADQEEEPQIMEEGNYLQEEMAEQEPVHETYAVSDEGSEEGSQEVMTAVGEAPEDDSAEGYDEADEEAAEDAAEYEGDREAGEDMAAGEPAHEKYHTYEAEETYDEYGQEEEYSEGDEDSEYEEESEDRDGSGYEDRYDAEAEEDDTEYEDEYDAEYGDGYDTEYEDGYDAEYEDEYDGEYEDEYDTADGYDEEQEYDERQDYDGQDYSGEQEASNEYERPVDDEELDLNDFADYAVKYASEIDCSITGKSMLALYERIEIMEEDGIPLTRTNAEDLIEEAADKAEKPSLGGLIKGVFSSKYDKDGLLILKEEHFI